METSHYRECSNEDLMFEINLTTQQIYNLNQYKKERSNTYGINGSENNCYNNLIDVLKLHKKHLIDIKTRRMNNKRKDD